MKKKGNKRKAKTNNFKEKLHFPAYLRNSKPAENMADNKNV
jgi:hypothetical protein